MIPLTPSPITPRATLTVEALEDLVQVVGNGPPAGLAIVTRARDVALPFGLVLGLEEVYRAAATTPHEVVAPKPEVQGGVRGALFVAVLLRFREATIRVSYRLATAPNCRDGCGCGRS